LTRTVLLAGGWQVEGLPSGQNVPVSQILTLAAGLGGEFGTLWAWTTCDLP